jgi:hypothetical protein
MSTLLLKFALLLENYNVPSVMQHHGPLFHRWLPDGIKDAIVLNTGDSNAKLKVWFERHGYVDTGHIKFDYERKEADPSIIPTQAILEGGPLYGQLEIQGLSEENLTCLKEDKVGSEAYAKLGKRIIKEIIHPTISRFIDILRTNYGQYWIRNIRPWDSRKRSLGDYCHSVLNLKWSLDEGKTWKPFIPDKPKIGPITLTVLKEEDFAEYLTEKDWRKLENVFNEGYRPSLACFLISQTYELLDQGNIKYALIDGVSALEVAISEFIRRNGAQYSESDVKYLKSTLKSLPIKARLIVVACISGKISKEDLENALQAIDIRNDIVHEGLDPPTDSEKRIHGLLNAAATLVSGPKFRFLTANPGNMIKPVERWEKEVKGVCR